MRKTGKYEQDRFSRKAESSPICASFLEEPRSIFHSISLPGDSTGNSGLLNGNWREKGPSYPLFQASLHDLLTCDP